MRKYRANRHFKAFDELIFMQDEGIFRLKRLLFELKNALSLPAVASNFTVFDLDDAICKFRDMRIVRDYDDGVALLVQRR